MRLSSLTSLGRSIDLKYPTNRTITLLSLSAMLTATAYYLFSGNYWRESISSGLQVGLTIFLAWALGRELDPDHDPTALVAAIFAADGFLLWGFADLGLIFWVLIAMRVVNRTTGLDLTIFDSLSFLALGGWQTWQGNWGIGILTVVALFLDGWLQPIQRRQWLFAGMGLIGIILALLVRETSTVPFSIRWHALLIALVSALAFRPVFLRTKLVNSRDDATGALLNPDRVMGGQLLAIVAGMGMALFGGLAGLVAMSPLWAALLAAVVFRFYMISGYNQTRDR